MARPDIFARYFRDIRKTVLLWERAFRKGFYANGRPVFVRCKKRNCVGGAPARHLARNTLEFCKRYFHGQTEELRTISTLHEMGHWLHGRATEPRDERHPLCHGGWNVAKNMCYRDLDRRLAGAMFRAGNPKQLRIAFDESFVPPTPDRQAGWRAFDLIGYMSNNVDNYVSWMWNRSLRP